MNEQNKQEMKAPAVQVQFRGITGCGWQTVEGEHGLYQIVDTDGNLIASVMPVPGDTMKRTFHRIFAEIIAASGEMMSQYPYLPTRHDDLLKKINAILNEPA